MTAFGVPVKVTVADCPEQTIVSELMATVGNGETVMVTAPDAGWLQLGVPEIATLISV